MPRRLNAVGPTKKIGRTLVRKKLRISEIVRSGLPTSETFLLSSVTTASYRYRRTTTAGFVHVLRGSARPVQFTHVGRHSRASEWAVRGDTTPAGTTVRNESRRTAEILRRDGHVTDLLLRVDQTDGTGQAATGTADSNTKLWAFTNGDNLFGACASRREASRCAPGPSAHRAVHPPTRMFFWPRRRCCVMVTREVWVGGVWR